MSNDIFNQFNNNSGNSTSSYSGAIPRTFVANVFSYMLAALSITGVVAYLVGSNEQLFLDLQKGEGLDT